MIWANKANGANEAKVANEAYMNLNSADGFGWISADDEVLIFLLSRQMLFTSPHSIASAL